MVELEVKVPVSMPWLASLVDTVACSNFIVLRIFFLALGTTLSLSPGPILLNLMQLVLELRNFILFECQLLPKYQISFVRFYLHQSFWGVKPLEGKTCLKF